MNWDTSKWQIFKLHFSVCFAQVHMDISRHRSHPLAPLKGACGARQASHHIVQLTRMAATDLHLDRLLHWDTTHRWHILTSRGPQCMLCTLSVSFSLLMHTELTFKGVELKKQIPDICFMLVLKFLSIVWQQTYWFSYSDQTWSSAALQWNKRRLSPWSGLEGMCQPILLGSLQGFSSQCSDHRIQVTTHSSGRDLRQSHHPPEPLFREHTHKTAAGWSPAALGHRDPRWRKLQAQINPVLSNKLK